MTLRRTSNLSSYLPGPSSQWYHIIRWSNPSLKMTLKMTCCPLKRDSYNSNQCPQWTIVFNNSCCEYLGITSGYLTSPMSKFKLPVCSFDKQQLGITCSPSECLVGITCCFPGEQLTPFVPSINSILESPVPPVSTLESPVPPVSTSESLMSTSESPVPPVSIFDLASSHPYFIIIPHH